MTPQKNRVRRARESLIGLRPMPDPALNLNIITNFDDCSLMPKKFEATHLLNSKLEEYARHERRKA